MQATTKQVKTIVRTLADIQGGSLYRRVWADKAVNESMRNMAFRFWSSKEADTVAERLQKELAAQGYTNKVRRTSVRSNYAKHTEGGEYVRVQAVFE